MFLFHYGSHANLSTHITDHIKCDCDTKQLSIMITRLSWCIVSHSFSCPTVADDFNCRFCDICSLELDCVTVLN